MAVPKRKHSKSRSRKRQTHDVLTAGTTTACKECGAKVSAHRVCPKCGFYKGRRVVTIKVKAKDNNKEEK